MKRILSTLFLICLLFSCAGDDYEPPTPRLWMKIQEGHLESEYPGYSPTDINIVVYKNYADYLNETGFIFKGKFDINGEVHINNLAQSGYFVDLYSSDNTINNWALHPPVYLSSVLYYNTNETSGLPINIIFWEKPIKKIIGPKWKFNLVEYGVPYDGDDLREINNLEVLKNKAIITDTYNNIEYIAEYNITEIFSTRIDLHLESITPSDDNIKFEDSVEVFLDPTWGLSKIGLRLKEGIISYTAE